MIEDKLKTIEETIANSPSMQNENKEAVLNLLSELKDEIKEVSEEKSKELAGLEGLNKLHNSDSKENDGLLRNAINEVNDTVKTFEENHPKLVQLVNSICTQLSNAGL